MIKKLSIRNYTLIDELNIEFNSGFSVITFANLQQLYETIKQIQNNKAT